MKTNKFIKIINIILAILVIALLVTNIVTLFYFTSKDDVGKVEDLNIEYYTYSNEDLGFKIDIPKGFELEEVEKNVRLFSEGGPMGNRITFVDNSREKGKFIIIKNLERTGYVLQTALDAHLGDPFAIQEATYVERAHSDILIKHSIGYIMAFQPRNISELRERGNEIPGYFEINASRDLENAEEILEQMFRSFEIIPIEIEIPEPASLQNPPEKTQ